MHALRVFNDCITILFLLCYSYQFLYIPVVWLLGRRRVHAEPRPNRFAFLICARNEETVIGDLIDSIHAQTYPQDRMTIFVMADNCTDSTADIAAQKGAVVYRRFDSYQIGKGYALEALRGHIREDFPQGFDGYFVFDADNILMPDFVEQMNKTFSAGHHVVTGYRNSKNYGDNWISAGYGLWFLRESRYLHQARTLLRTSCNVSGTGFLFSRAVSERIGDWPYHLLTEDIEFSVHQILQGERIVFCPDAMFFDEQPTSFSQSWHQRLRWTKGYLQVFRRYGTGLLRGMTGGSFACFDMAMNIMPAYILSALSLVVNLSLCVLELVSGGNLHATLASVGTLAVNLYATLFFMGVITTATEWKNIRERALRKIAACFTFPLFMLTFVPISMAALFWKGKWHPITHSVTAKRLVSAERNIQ